MTTNEFLDSLDYEQLQHCKERTEALIKRKDEETRVALWVVSDEDINYAWFKEDDYTAAVDRMVREIRNEAGRRGTPISMEFSLAKHRYRESEVAALLEASK